jgi:hypothetical protein
MSEHLLKWAEVGHDYDGVTVAVSAESTPEKPLGGAGPWVGVVDCRAPGAVPLLRVGREVHSFAGWFDVKMVRREDGSPLQR